jgi:hypothetical protein
LFDFVTRQEGQSQILHSITVQVLHAAHVALILLLLLALQCLKTFIKAAPSNEEFPVLVAGRNNNVLEIKLLQEEEQYFYSTDCDRHHSNNK